MSTSTANLDAAIAMMNDPTLSGFDVVIVCCSDDSQAAYWGRRLESGLCKPKPSPTSTPSSTVFPMVLAVSEDWGAGGAGNGLGTLYAFQKASLLATTKHNIDLPALLSSSSISAALYHTAGKGTRMAPLPASENNNKPGVRLPATIVINGQPSPITVLEAVIKQTGVYAPSRKGRLSVYWGDQVFIPSAPTTYTPSHHVDIMCTLGQMVNEADWKLKGYDKYGVIAVAADGNAAQVEKVTHATATKMLKSLRNVVKVGPSLGSFSVSAAMLSALVTEFDNELKAKGGKLDTDPHFWMPMTLALPDYVELMEAKGVKEEESTKHYKRMEGMISAFAQSSTENDMKLFGAVDVGSEACWWDYGQLKLYSTNNLKFVDNDDNSDMLRKFFGVLDRKSNSALTNVDVCTDSCVLSSNVKSGTIKQSVMSCVNCTEINANGAIIINVTARKITAPAGCILYNIIDDSEDGITVLESDVRVGVFTSGGECTIVNSSMLIDGGENWKVKVMDNLLTFEELHKVNGNSDVSGIEDVREGLHRKLREGL